MADKKTYPWFRMYHKFYTDPDVIEMEEKYQARLVRLFCARCALGEIREKSVPTILRISKAETAETKEIFLENGFIDDSWQIINWDKRQYEGDHSKERTKNWRDRKKTVTLCDGHTRRHIGVTVTAEDTDTEAESSVLAKKDYGFNIY